MIAMKFPHMALNAEDVPQPRYKMWNTYEVPESHAAEKILTWTATVARGAPGGKLGSLVINCHGYEVKSRGGYGLQLGTGLQRRHTALFKGLKGLLGEIHIVACKAAEIADPGTSGDGDGNLFCCEIAKNAGVNVYASTAKQTPGMWNDAWGIPYGKIDDYEGDVFRWRPDGSCQAVKL
jgi:hypothetical protein